MNYLLAALSFALHTLFWGAGLARLILPGGWQRWWWAFAPGLGWALQSAVVWLAANLDLPGTNSYAYASELVPVLFLGLAFGRGRTGWFANWRGIFPAMVLMVVAGWLLIAPMQSASRGLSAVSLGSCDHADYAAGARVLGEFSKNDRVGFLDLPEVTKIGGAERFFEYWLRLNHFTPAALLAHHGSVFGYEGWQLVSVVTAMLVVLNVPQVLLFARVVFGLRGSGATVVAALYAISPLCAYGVHHGALAQFLATQGVMLVTLAARGAGWRWLPLAVAAVWLLAGSYNFFLMVAFAPAAGWLIWRGMFRGQWKAVSRGTGVLVASLGICAVIFRGRFAGILERFRLLDIHDFGWPVPLQGPPGWLGVVQGQGLDNYPTAVVVLLSAGLILLMGFWIWRERAQVLAPLAVLAPVLVGYLMLAERADDSANASYNAYKFLAVFLPVFLGGCLGWLRALPLVRPSTAPIFITAIVALLAANLTAQADFRTAVARAPLVVTSELRTLQQLESEPRITSLNLRIEDFWARLWANTFLLKKPQYFVTHSYEARKDTPLHGAWDLTDSLLRVIPPHPEDVMVVNPRFHAVKAGSPAGIAAGFGAGWYPEESDGRLARWRWSDGEGVVHISNTTATDRVCRLELSARPAKTGDMMLSMNGQPVHGGTFATGTVQSVSTTLLVPPGESILRVTTEQHVLPDGSDPRRLGVALLQFELWVGAPGRDSR